MNLAINRTVRIVNRDGENVYGVIVELGKTWSMVKVEGFRNPFRIPNASMTALY